MAVNVTVGARTPTRELRSTFRTLGRGKGEKSRAYKAVAQSLQGSSAYVADGVADLDATGAISALGQKDRIHVANTLRAVAPSTGGFRSLVDACAEAIENASTEATRE